MPPRANPASEAFSLGMRLGVAAVQGQEGKADALGAEGSGRGQQHLSQVTCGKAGNWASSDGDAELV